MADKTREGTNPQKFRKKNYFTRIGTCCERLTSPAPQEYKQEQADPLDLRPGLEAPWREASRTVKVQREP